MDYKSPVLIVAASDRHVYAVSMEAPQNPPIKVETLLKMQLRAVRVTHDRKGFVAASIEGRCGIHYFEQAKQTYGLFSMLIVTV